MFKKNQIKLFLISFMAIAIVHNLNLASANSSKIETEGFSKIEQEQKLFDSSSNSSDKLILVKKSGGRSGGGSFKSRPSRSKRSSPSRSSQQREYDSPSRRYNQRRYDDSPNYRNSNPTYYNRGRRNSAFPGFIVFIIFLGIPLLGILFALSKASKANANSSSKAERKIVKERDNNRVTISLLQVALSSSALDIQRDLSELSKAVDTSTDAGLVELLQESALILLRSDRDWTHVLANSYSLDIAEAEEEFDKLSLIERSKFSSESLSNIDGNIKTRESRHEESDGFPAYVVVTLIAGTADDNPLFERIHNSADLKEALLKLSSIRADYLMKFELLWTPQKQGEYLTDEELLMEYTEIMPL